MSDHLVIHRLNAEVQEWIFPLAQVQWVLDPPSKPPTYLQTNGVEPSPQVLNSLRLRNYHIRTPI
ncbi:hypothetical protein HYC85_020060 [Camellia sinensis]|uniref:Uncharacterized protein n=1 Tax=Camellia sinensis TaxID=4442 RepID=A0A7J7GSL9_CAMSI|nr:hypothetical protein HYC85_020060 [Camellia sinensis]